jgi:hypothetical protein
LRRSIWQERIGSNMNMKEEYSSDFDPDFSGEEEEIAATLKIQDFGAVFEEQTNDENQGSMEHECVQGSTRKQDDVCETGYSCSRTLYGALI